jgi:hypothetical protein
LAGRQRTFGAAKLWKELLQMSVLAVHAFNQRDIAGILAMIRTVGALR